MGTKRTVVWKNWAGNIQCRPHEIVTPNSEEEIVAIVQKAKGSGLRVKVVGAGHSCSRIAVSNNAYHISLDDLNQLIEVDQLTGLVTVQAGIRIADLNELLSQHNLALPNLGVIDEQSISGAISTGTHGTGLNYGTISSFIVGLRIVLASGEVVDASPNENIELFHAARVGLGSLGIISTVTLTCVPAFNLHICEHPSTLENALLNLEEHLKNERFGFWWFPHTDAVRLWLGLNTNEQLKNPKSKFQKWKHDVLMLNRGHELALWIAKHRSSLVPKINRFVQKYYFNQPVTRVVPSAEGFRQTILIRQRVLEYAIPLQATVPALYGLKQIIERKGYNVHYPVDVRFSAADEAWLSPAYGRQTCYIGIIMYRPFGSDVPYEDYFCDVDALFTQLEGRPHWGKIHYRTASDLSSVYPYWNDFLRLRAELDPQGIFLNDYLECIFGIGG
jgi:L-gulonolactone oxidase